ncbi:hypothetical protein [uncultured Celeribacter sp.]|uniref:hypothetical protein n=1 Tax=uncultured Celeribacter sp. TaxID=1303376 RepID=UPI002AA7C28A|nr:hypothetical protein [uncultured Celeribacter sp.]
MLLFSSWRPWQNAEDRRKNQQNQQTLWDTIGSCEALQNNDLPAKMGHSLCQPLKKNPGSAATGTGIKPKVKASSFLGHLTANLDVEATSNQGGKLLPGDVS